MASHPEVTASLLGSLGSDRPTPYLPRRNDVLWYLLVASTILAVVAFRLVYLVWLCPFDLAPDEAHYWDWSRQLDWCYYSKGPMVAWLIRAAEATCGAWLRDTHGTTMPAVRLPAVVCGGFFALGVFVFTYQLSASLSLAYFTMLAILLTPHFTALSTLITIDSPFLCFWQWSLVAAYRAILPDCSWDTSNNCGPAVPTLTDPRKNCRTSAWLSWWILGSFIGLGILAKPTMVLFPACLVLFLTGYRPARHHFRSSRFWLMMMVAGILGAGPILWWNAHHDWVTFRHVLTQATLTSSGRWRPWGWLEYLGVQCALLFGAGFLLWLLASRWAARVCRSQDVSPHTRATAGFL
ncbi:MAG: glycosyltransferase family 39 protein, partial [Gemmatales bacterium]|nr:glycosyltransferase family 39 protein [Gemmatales bacterium]MDW8176059.1 glycosyltransferase family 39 protein [Gemmatales bacterium]